MNRSTLIVVVLVLVLAGIYLAVSLKDKPGREDIITLSLPEVGLDDQGDPLAPLSLELSGGDGKLALSWDPGVGWTRDGRKGAAVDSGPARRILQALAGGLSSDTGRKVGPEDLVSRGLDEEHRVHLKLSSRDRVLVELLVGDCVGRDRMVDTWVLAPGRDAAFLLPECSLCSDVRISPQDLQDTRVFSLTEDRIVGLKVRDPRDGTRGEIEVLRGVEGWGITRPLSLPAGDVESYLTTLTRLRGVRFAERLPPSDQAALDQVYRVQVLTDPPEPEPLTLEIGAGRGDQVWARSSTRAGVFTISAASAQTLLAGLSDFMDKRIFPYEVDPELVAGIELSAPTGPVLTAARAPGGSWTSVQPGSVLLEPASMDRLATSFLLLRTRRYKTEPDWDRTWLSSPHFTLTMRFHRELSPRVLHLQPPDRENDKAPVAGWIEGETFGLELARFSFQSLAKELEDLRDKRIFRLAQEEVASISSVWKTGRMDFFRSSPESPWMMKTDAGEQPVDLSQYLGTLCNLPVHKVFEEQTEQRELDILITFSTWSGARHRLWIGEEVIDGDNRVLAPDEPDSAGRVLGISRFRAVHLIKTEVDFLPRN